MENNNVMVIMAGVWGLLQVRILLLWRTRILNPMLTVQLKSVPGPFEHPGQTIVTYDLG